MEPIFKKSWLEAISYLPESVRNRIVLIVMLFQLSGTLPEKMSSTVRCAVRFILAELGVDLSTLAGTSLFPPQKDSPKAEMPKEPEPQPEPEPKPEPLTETEPKDSSDSPTQDLFIWATKEDRSAIRLGVNIFHKYILKDNKQCDYWPQSDSSIKDMVECFEKMKKQTSFPSAYVRNHVEAALSAISKYIY